MIEMKKFTKINEIEYKNARILIFLKVLKNKKGIYTVRILGKHGNPHGYVTQESGKNLDILIENATNFIDKFRH